MWASATMRPDRNGVANSGVQPRSITGEETMTRGLYPSAAILALALAMSAPAARLQAQTPPGLSAGAAEIVGVVTGPAGPEAGVWVIAEQPTCPPNTPRS